MDHIRSPIKRRKPKLTFRKKEKVNKIMKYSKNKVSVEKEDCQLRY